MTTIIDNIQLDYSDVLIQPKRTTLNSRKEADIIRTYKFKYYKNTLNSTGITVANMATTGTFEMAKAMTELNGITCLQKHYTVDEIISFLKSNKNNELVFISTGIKDDEFAKTCQILDTGLVDKVCVDIANGYIPNLAKFVKKLREKYDNNILIMAGNVVTSDMTQELILNGADLVKVGIGPGSACITRKITGVGRPQLSAVMECADAAHGMNGMICADGGCTCPGDIVKAYAGGADFVMLGGMLAGSKEAAGEVIKRDDKELKLFYGMSSQYAQNKHWGKMNSYRASEGRVVEIPYTGPVAVKIEEIYGGVRSAMTYIGARRLKDIPKCATFYKVNRQLNEVFAK